MQIHSLRKYDLGTNIISLDLKGKKTPQISSSDILHYPFSGRMDQQKDEQGK